jgi:hypothetical protein
MPPRDSGNRDYPSRVSRALGDHPRIVVDDEHHGALESRRPRNEAIGIAIELIGDYHASCVRRVISRQTTVARLSLDYAIAGAARNTKHSKYAPALASHLRGCPRCKVLGGAGAMRAGVPMLRDVIPPVLLLFDAGERDKVLFRIVSDQQWTLIEGRVQRLFDHKSGMTLTRT